MGNTDAINENLMFALKHNAPDFVELYLQRGANPCEVDLYIPHCVLVLLLLFFSFFSFPHYVIINPLLLLLLLLLLILLLLLLLLLLLYL